jgi:NAD(P)-dependent dehydrogenase (short-subunit alcohol dehydrogenase family)
VSGVSAAAAKEQSSANRERIVRIRIAGAYGRAGPPAYQVTKAALNALTRTLAGELRHAHILVNAVCPGWVATDMGGAGAPRSVEEGAAGVVWAATLPQNGPTGGFFRDGKPLPW